MGEARERVRTACKDHKHSPERLGGVLGLSESRIASWFAKAHVPAYLLGQRDVPAALRARIATDLLGIAGPDDGPRSDIETDTANLLRDVLALGAEIAVVLIDRRVDAREQGGLRPLVARVRARCDRWLHDYGLPAAPGVQ
jgi:hypothetical protein